MSKGKRVERNVENKDDFLRNFIERNHSLVMEYHRCHYNRHKVSDWREQLRMQFVKALSAGGEGNITEKADSVKEFVRRIQEMKRCTYKELKRVFDDAKSYEDLFEALANKKYKQMASKKAALFLRDVFYLGEFITVQTTEVKYFKVPVDRVIVRTMNAIYPAEKYKVNGSFGKINDKAKKVFPLEPILLEDLWFWGHFYRCKEGRKNKANGIPFCKFNHDLLAVDINVTKKYREKLLVFADANPKCPIRKICSK